jgi:hypothetical protein
MHEQRNLVLRLRRLCDAEYVWHELEQGVAHICSTGKVLSETGATKMVLCHMTFTTILLQEAAMSGVRHLPGGVLFGLGSLLLAIGTILRRGLSVRQEAANPHAYRRRPQSVDGSRRTVESVRSAGAHRTRANAV